MAENIENKGFAVYNAETNRTGDEAMDAKTRKNIEYLIILLISAAVLAVGWSNRKTIAGWGNQNTEDIIPCILKYLPYGPMFYDEDTVTDQPQRQIAAEIIREKALHALDAEIPHGIAVAIDTMKERPGKRQLVDIEATIICERDSHKGIIIGKQGAMLKKIGSNARYELEQMLDAKVNLKLWVKVRKDWRDSDFMIKNFGYDKKEI